MLMKIKYIDNALAYFTQNNVYTVIALDNSGLHPTAFVFDDNGVLRKTNYINDTGTNQWEIYSIEYGNCITVYP